MINKLKSNNNSSREMVKIRYNWWGNANIKNRVWEAILPNGDVLDYGSISRLIRVCEEEGYDWQVLRYHRNGKISVMKSRDNI